MTQDQYLGPLLAMTPAITGVLVGWGLDNTTAGLGAMVIVSLAAAVWSFLSNRLTSMAAKVGSVPGVQVVVKPQAPPELKALAADPAVPGVVPLSKVK